MPLYESTFIVRQDVSTQEVEKVADEFVNVIKDHKGKLIKKENWGLRNLAYKVQKNRKGHYVMLGFEANSDTVTELNRRYKLSEDVIRNLTIAVDEISKEPSAIMKKVNGSDE